EAEHGLLERHGDLLPERTLGRTFLHPRDQLAPDTRRLTEKERIHGARAGVRAMTSEAGGELPTPDDECREGDAKHEDERPPSLLRPRADDVEIVGSRVGLRQRAKARRGAWSAH